MYMLTSHADDILSGPTSRPSVICALSEGGQQPGSVKSCFQRLLITTDDLSEIIALCPIGCQSTFFDKQHPQGEILPFAFGGFHPSRCLDYQVKDGCKGPFQNERLSDPIKNHHGRTDR
jgi:hypothetical protein